MPVPRRAQRHEEGEGRLAYPGRAAITLSVPGIMPPVIRSIQSLQAGMYARRASFPSPCVVSQHALLGQQGGFLHAYAVRGVREPFHQPAHVRVHLLQQGLRQSRSGREAFKAES